jgi:RNA polymerase sigma-70 factor (ECF subfamily)
LQSFKKGEEQAFDQLYREYFISLSYFANQLIHNAAGAEDIVQDCFVSLWKRRHKLGHIEDIKNYLYTSIRYQCMRVLSKREKQLPVDQTITDDATIENLIITAETAKEIYRLIETLAPGMQQVIKLYYLEGKSYTEIAQILGIDAESVRKAKYRALLTLRKTNIPLS